jgi:hypothetical protein
MLFGFYSFGTIDNFIANVVALLVNLMHQIRILFFIKVVRTSHVFEKTVTFIVEVTDALISLTNAIRLVSKMAQLSTTSAPALYSMLDEA